MGKAFSTCCSRKRCRIVVLGLDIKAKSEVYFHLTKETASNNKEVKYDEKKIHINGLTVYLCNISSEENVRNLWPCQIKHSDGIIFVVNAADESGHEEIKNEFIKIVENVSSDDRTFVLVLCNKGTEATKPLFSKYKDFSNVKVQNCVIEEWKGMEEGLKWLCENIKG